MRVSLNIHYYFLISLSTFNFFNVLVVPPSYENRMYILPPVPTRGYPSLTFIGNVMACVGVGQRGRGEVLTQVTRHTVSSMETRASVLILDDEADVLSHPATSDPKNRKIIYEYT